MAVSTPAVYFLPRRYLNRNAADMLVAHAVYYLLACEGRYDPLGARRVTTTPAALMQLAGVSVRELPNQLNALAGEPAPYTVLSGEEGGDDRGYELVQPAYRQAVARDVIQMPAGLVANGWLPSIYSASKSRFALAIVADFLRRPPDRRTVSIGELRQRIKHPDRQQPPDMADVQKQLRRLAQWGVVTAEDAQHYTLHAGVFAGTPAQAQARAADTTVALPAVLLAARATQPARAQFVETLLALGELDAHAHAAEMLRDVGYLRSALERELLAQKVARERFAPPGSDRWRTIWAAYCRSRDRRLRQHSGARVWLDLGAAAAVHAIVPLPQPRDCHVHWARLVIAIEDPDYVLPFAPPIALTLLAAEATLWARSVAADDGMLRCDLSAAVQQRVLPDRLLLHAQSDVPLPRVRLAAQIELSCLQPPARSQRR